MKDFKFSDLKCHFAHIQKQVGAPSVSQNSWGAKSASVSTKDTHDAYDKNIHFISKEKEFWFCQG